MLHLSNHVDLPRLHQTKLQKYLQRRELELNELMGALANNYKKANNKPVPSSIEKEMKAAIINIEKLQRLFAEVAKSCVKLSAAQLTKNKAAAESTLNEYKRKLKSEQSAYDSRWTDRAISVFVPIFAIWQTVSETSKFLGDPDGYKTPGQRMLDDIAVLERQVSYANDELSRITKWQKDFPEVDNTLFKQLYIPGIFAIIASHACKIHTEINKYAAFHRTTANKVAQYAEQSHLKCHAAMLALLRGSYTMQDLQVLIQYGAEARITSSPEQRSLLQFINHSLAPHIDYFEIWAGKIDELETMQDEIEAAINKKGALHAPPLEILGQKAPRLSGRVPEKPVNVADNKATIAALNDGLKRHNDARDQVMSLICKLKDKSNGDLPARHKLVKEEARAIIENFNRFFTGMDHALNNINNILDNKNTLRAKTWQAYLGAEAIACQKELLLFNSPENLRDYNHMVLLETSAVMGNVRELVAGAIRSHHSIERYKKEYAIRISSLLERYQDPAPLKQAIKELDKEIEKLVHDKEFMEFQSRIGAIENLRCTYMLLTRLVAGESNIDALLLYYGDETPDHFIAALNKMNPRLGEAMENFLYGFADGNDVNLLLAAANGIMQPKTPLETVLVSYVEEVIKPHFNDMSRQASIVDVLQMRNSLYTGHDFHSFGEVVKSGTDHALHALLSGKGDFTLVGNHEIHQLFGYWLTRHGEDNFIDPFNHNNRQPRQVALVSQHELQACNKEIAFKRNENTRLPKASNIFIQLCSWEYLLSQGHNIVTDNRLASHPQALGVMEMVNETVAAFIKKLSLDKAWQGKDASGKGLRRIGNLVEGLIADSCVQFFSELGAFHHHEKQIIEKLQMVRNAFAGENFSLPHSLYTKTITNDAIRHWELFLQVYRRNLEHFLRTATRKTQAVLIDQLLQVKDIMPAIQLTNEIDLPNSPQLQLEAYYRNHSLEYVGLNRATWMARSAAIQQTIIKQ